MYIPEEKYDALYMMKEKLDEMEEKLNEQVRTNIDQKQRIEELTAYGIFEEVTDGLADSQRDKLSKLAENVEFESEEQYRDKLETLKEAYISRGVEPKQITAAQTLTESADGEGFRTSGDPLMDSVMNLL